MVEIANKRDVLENQINYNELKASNDLKDIEIRELKLKL